MVNIKTEFPRGINSDQVISLGLKPTGRLQGVHPGPGLKLGEMDIASSKPQALSSKLQAPSSSNLKRQASSPKHKGSSFKPQAASSWTLLPGKSFKHL
jgi:hypothetical protein